MGLRSSCVTRWGTVSVGLEKGCGKPEKCEERAAESTWWRVLLHFGSQKLGQKPPLGRVEAPSPGSTSIAPVIYPVCRTRGLEKGGPLYWGDARQRSQSQLRRRKWGGGGSSALDAPSFGAVLSPESLRATGARCAPSQRPQARVRRRPPRPTQARPARRSVPAQGHC